MSRDKGKILFLFNKFPFPPVGGDRLKVYNLGRILSRYYSIDLVCINDAGTGIKRFSIDPFDNVVCFNYPALRFKMNATAGVFSSKPFQIHYYHFGKVQRYIDTIIDNYDLVFCNLLRMAPYVINKRIPKIIDMADSIALTYGRFYNYATGLWKLLYRIDAKRLIDYEVEVVEYFDKTLLVNRKEKEIIVSKGAPADKIKIITNGIDKAFTLREKPNNEAREIVFFGRLAAFHNKDAVLYFAKKILPLVSNERKDIKFVVIGADPPPEILRLRQLKNVEVCGYLEDPYDRISKAMLCVFPMRICAGVQNKILEAMALAKAVVTTPIAVEAIDGEDGKHFILADNEMNMCGRILNLLNDEKLRGALGYNARELIKQKYTWDNFEKELIVEVENLINLDFGING